MAWLRSEQELEHHPKLFRLIAVTGWEKDAAIGRLHRFWWWVQKYAETGSLDPFTWAEIDAAMGFPPGQNFIKSLIASGFVDKYPALRVHDWWDHNGPWLMTRYKHYPEKWEDVKRCYKSENRMNRSKNVLRTGKERSKNVKRTVDVNGRNGRKERPQTPRGGAFFPEVNQGKNQDLTPRATGTNPRAVGTNSRALGTNPRALAVQSREEYAKAEVAKIKAMENISEKDLPTGDEIRAMAVAAGLRPGSKNDVPTENVT